MSQRSDTLAERIAAGAAALAGFVAPLTPEEWLTEIPDERRTVAALVHHVANAYPREVEFAQMLASGQPVACITWAAIDAWNAEQGREFAAISKEDALELLQRTSREAALAVTALTDEELDSAAPISIYGSAPLSAQFFIEDHAVRHSYHHLANIRAAFSETEEPAEMLRIWQPA